MPIYEYSCQKCGAHIEVMQKISDRPLTRHPKCGGRLAKEWSRTGFQLKGSGWYVTDYAGKQPDAKEPDAKDGKEAKAEAAEAKPGAGKTKDVKIDAKKEAKPAKKKESAPAGGD